MSDHILARFRTTDGEHTFELVETPKGLVEARIDGCSLNRSEVKELKQWLNAWHLEESDHGS